MSGLCLQSRILQFTSHRAFGARLFINSDSALHPTGTYVLNTLLVQIEFLQAYWWILEIAERYPGGT